MQMALKRCRGFTLIELAIVAVLLGIIAMFAIPAYMDTVHKTRRADAKGALVSFTEAMERFYNENNTYKKAAGTKASPSDTGSPWVFASEAPVDGNEKYYNLTISAATATTYTLQAKPKASQAGDGCLQIDSDNNRYLFKKDDCSGNDKESW